MTDSGSRHSQEPIAIVGVSALFPGSVDHTGFWRDILAGRDMITDVPPSHWLIEDYFDADQSKPDKTYAKRGAFLQDIDFDPMGWGVPPSLVPQTDTSQLLGLIVARQVLDDACDGQFATMDRSRVSCVLGVTSGQELMGSMVSRLQRPVWVKALRESGIPETEVTAICDRISSSYTKWEEGNFPGLLGNVVAGRIANRLDLGGTNCVTDAACASTFSALSMAVNELSVGQSDLVIAGGVDAMNDIFMYVCFSKTPALSPTGDCRPFSEASDGTMLGEGLGMVALKRLSDAERDGDRVYAVIRGVGSSSDGRSKSVYAPVSEGQAKAIRRAYATSGYSPSTVELVEAHGTGTKAGDVAEFEGLRMVFEDDRAQDRPWCALGSVKSQIGHTKSAAGAAGLIKAVLALHHKVLPPTIKVDKPNPKLKIDASPFYLNTRARPWVRGSDHLRRAGVSSFGFGGSNFHVSVEEYVGPTRLAWRLRTMPSELVLLSADGAPALADVARAMADAVQSAVSEGRAGMLAYLARTTQESLATASRTRLSVVAKDETDLVTKLRAAADGLAKGVGAPMHAGVSVGEGAHEGSVAFLYPGQGSQYVSMGADVAMHFDDARSAWDLSADLALGEVPLHEVVFPQPVFTDEAAQAQQKRLTATEWAQPGLGATSLAVHRVLSRVGLAPAAVAGHSFGEVMALHAAGALSAGDMLHVARRRGELMAEAAQKTHGAMTAVVANIDAVRAHLAGTKVVVANHNAPDQVVISGETDGVAAVEEKLRAAGVAFRRLEVATAFHSEVVSAARGPFAEALAGVAMSAPTMPVYANATAAPYAGDPRQTLSDQLAMPVRFVETIEAMYAAGVRTFVEVGPGSVLTGLVSKVLGARPHRAIATDRKGSDGVTALHIALGRLAVAGLPMNLGALWTRYAPAHDPRTDARPKVTLKLNGSNYAKPYPPKGGAAALPKPNPERPAPVAPKAEEPAQRVSMTAPKSPEPVVVSAPTPVASPAPSPVAYAQPVGALPQGAQHAWIQAFQETQRQTAEAHAAFQRAMSDSHSAFLRAAEASFAGLAAMMNPGAPQPQFASAPMMAAPAPVYALPPPPPPPVMAAPVQVVAAPVQVVAAPVQAPPAPAPVVAAPAPAPAAAAPAVDLMTTMLDVVSLKTGYPKEMIGRDMELEADLGIDSIKRVEILAAVRERAPGLPDLDPAALGALRTVGQIVDHMLAHLPAQPVVMSTVAVASAAASPAAPPPTDLMATMLDVVSQKTGYPKEMIGRDMELEADLGIDSIKRVEILAAVRERAPGLPDLDPAALGALRTVGQIVDHMLAHLPSQPASVSVAATPAPAAAPSIDLMATMLDVVSQKTGYPKEMIGRDMELEADLGIDSIKRVEILAAVRERAPGLPDLDPAALGALRTVGQIVDHMLSHLGGGAATTTSTSDATPAARTTPDATGRYILRAMPREAIGLVRTGLLDARDVVVTDDGAGVATALAKRLTARGIPSRVAAVPEKCDAVIFLGGLRDVADVDAALAVEREAFRAARAVATGRGKTGGVFVTVQDTGGDFGISGGDAVRAWLGGLAGLAKTAAQEWSGAHVRAIDVARGGRDAEVLATALADELTAGGPELEVGLRADGTRVVLESFATTVTAGTPALLPGDVVVASGGARGVTAATLIALVRATKCRLVLLGRTALVDDPACVRGVTGDAALKKALLDDAKARGEALAPAELGRRVESIAANREVRANLDAVRTAGGEARYEAVDVTDAAAVSRTLDAVRAAWGPIAGVVHGAGVIADRAIADKTDAQFEKVFRTKVDGLRALLDATRGDALKVLCLFSSVAGRCGNVGQSDYAMANEILNKVAAVEKARRGPATVVKSLGWGPWEGGMVTPALKARFESMGVPLISLDGGAKMLVDELSTTSGGDVELVLGGEPRAEALASTPGAAERPTLAWRIDAHTHPHITSHEVRGVPVVPAMMALEVFARAAKAHRPDLTLTAVRELQVLKGIRLSHYGDVGDRFTVEARAVQNGGGLTLAVMLFGADGTRCYSAKVEMDARAHAPSRPAPTPGALTPWRDVIYDGAAMFHGPKFHAIQGLEGESEQGLVATLLGQRELGWLSAGHVTDTALLDGAVQLGVLWIRRRLGGSSLPTSLGAFLPYRDATGPVRAVLVGRAVGRERAVFDVTLLGDDGAPVCELRDLELHVLPGSTEHVARA